jgi:EAL domain-containing protein (putative c-di-GMP-specific phosphodiesterase class I)
VYQPIFKIADRTVVGYEALTRFQCAPLRSPDQWFAEAAEVGMGHQLEYAAAQQALAGLPHLPKGAYLSLNIAPETLLTCKDLELLLGGAPERLVLEVTEHSTIEDYDAIASVLAPLRKRGLRLAVDDAGAGYASFRHILQLKPDIIKLDRSLISGLNANRDQLALAAALVSFAEKTGIKVVAEGVETPEELKALQTLNVNKAQGYLLGRPTPLRDITG